MLGSGTGSEVMRRIAAPMVGGLVTTLVLALIVLPAVYVLVYRRSTVQGQGTATRRAGSTGPDKKGAGRM